MLQQQCASVQTQLQTLENAFEHETQRDKVRPAVCAREMCVCT